MSPQPPKAPVFRFSTDPFFPHWCHNEDRKVCWTKNDSALIPFCTKWVHELTRDHKPKNQQRSAVGSNLLLPGLQPERRVSFMRCYKTLSYSLHLSDSKYVFLHTRLTPESLSRKFLLRNMILCGKCPGPPSLVATDQVLLSLTGLISQQGHRERDKQTGNSEINTFSAKLHD